MLPWIPQNKNILKAAAVAIFLSAAAFVFLNVPAVLAQDAFGVQPVGESILLGGGDIRVIIGKIVRAALGLLGVIATAIIIYAGYLIMTSEGDEEKITKGKRTLVNAVIGLAIILSALAITQFILNSLSGATRGRPGTPGEPPAWDSFAGSGALGRVVREHYPFSNQTDVPRNTKITVSFMEAVDTASLIENSNNTCWGPDNAPTTTCDFSGAEPDIPYYGDCIFGENFSWEASCDHVKNDAVRIYQSTSTDFGELSPTDFVQAAAMALYEKNLETNEYSAFTFVFKPYNPQYLGNAEEDTPYTVYLTNKISKKPAKPGADPISVFANQYQQFYSWNFETGTTLDLMPPTVKAVRPRANSAVKKNNIVQVYFSEPMDPTVVEGYLTPNSISHLFFNVAATGTWRLSNGYQTAEFISDKECGVNSCGEKMYCLPLPDCADPADKNCAQNYEALVRTGEFLIADGANFEAKPFSGVMDMAGNGLDGNKNDLAEKRPASGLPFAEQKKPDNYFWPFTVKNEIDREAPVVETMLPEIDKENAAGKEAVKIRFSKVMTLSSFYPPNIFLDEHPTAIEATADWEEQVEDVLGFYLDSDLVADGDEDKTETKIKPTREFGPYNLDLYYFPQISSRVRTETQNCFYPGRGPWGNRGEAPVCIYKEDENGNAFPNSNSNCVPVNMVSSTDTGCAQTSDVNKILQSDVSGCLEIMKENSEWKE